MEKYGIEEIDSLVNAFYSGAAKVKRHVRGILKNIAAGQAPSKDFTDCLYNDIRMIQAHYNNMIKLAQEKLPAAELPVHNSSIKDYARAVAENIRRTSEHEIRLVCRTLERFISVKAHLELYAKELQPYQEQAKNALKAIEEGASENTEASNVFIRSCFFLKALTLDNFNNEPELYLLDNIGKYYRRKVERGLLCKQYYLEIAPGDDYVIPELPPHENTDNISKKEIKTAASGLSSEGKAPDLRSDEGKKSELVQPQIKSAAQPIRERTSDIHEDDEGLLKVSNKVKDSIPSASSFKREVIKLPQEVRTILPLLAHFEALTGKQIYYLGVVFNCFIDDEIAFDQVSRCLVRLAQRGWISVFDYKPDKTKAYCLSPYIFGCLKKDSVANGMRGFFKIPLELSILFANFSIPRVKLENTVAYNALLCDYFYGMREEDRVCRDKIPPIRASGIYMVNVFDNDKKYECLLYNPNVPMGDCDNLLVIDNKFDRQSLPSFKQLFMHSGGKVLKWTDHADKKVNSHSAVKTEEQKAVVVKVKPSESAPNVAVPVIPVKTELSLLEKTVISPSVPDDAAFLELAGQISTGTFCSKGLRSDVTRATMLLYAASLDPGNIESRKMFRMFSAATRLFFDDIEYDSETLNQIFADCPYECLLLSGYMQAMVTPSVAYDHGLAMATDNYLQKFDDNFPGFPTLKPLFMTLTKIREVIPEGFTLSLLAHLGDEHHNKIYTDTLKQRGAELLLPNINIRIRPLPKIYGECFGSNSDFYVCMDIIANNRIKENEFVAAILKEFCDVKNGKFKINTGKIENAIGKMLPPGDKYNLSFRASSKLKRDFFIRLALMNDWIEHTSKTGVMIPDVARTHKLRADIIKHIDEALSVLPKAKAEYIHVLISALQRMKAYLNMDNLNKEFKEFLLSGVFSVDDNGVPIIDATWIHIKYYEPWRNVLRHVIAEVADYDGTKQKILDKESSLFDNLCQLSMIEAEETGNPVNAIPQTQIKQAEEFAERNTTRFKEELELDFTYNRIDESEKERILAIVERYKPDFYLRRDFGCWGQFLGALKKGIAEATAIRKDNLRRELDERKKNFKSEGIPRILREAETLLENAENFAVTEEYLNRYDNGEKEFSDELSAIIYDRDYFNDFLCDDRFLPLYKECRRNSGKALKAFAWNYLDERVSQKWTSRQREDSRKMIENWPAAKGAAELAIKKLFTGFGFNINNVIKDDKCSEELYKVYIEPSPKDKSDYRHPIALFGTQMNPVMNVVALYGNFAPQQLVDTICSLDLGSMPVVLVDRYYERAQRRQIAEIFHATSGHNPFILIDQVLMLYLAMHQVTERLPVLLKCALPYTTYQPFIRDGGSTPDEMFCGRSKELATIIDPNGACVVYGGRQLGKTALLQRAENRFHKPDKGKYAIYSNIINFNSEKDLVAGIVNDINDKTGFKIPIIKTIDELCRELDLILKDKINSLLLLLDEADKFLSSISSIKYKPLQGFIDLKRKTSNRFKFVLAGLHNVCRAQNATIENGVFGQLGTPLCIKPLSPTDALRLLSRPLKYLGFRIDRHQHLETILTNTNYYPGILQFFGYMLVQEFNDNYSKYYRASDGHPPFTLRDDQLGAVMNSADMNRSIKDKFRLSLELDSRYFMIARCICILHHLRDDSEADWLGYSIDKIMGMAKDYNIHCLAHTSRAEYHCLLDEMTEMGILNMSTAGLYRLRRNSFINIIGSDLDTLDAEISASANNAAASL